jgi:hypothetical protein
MELLEGGLNQAWPNQSTQPVPPYPEQDQLANTMGVTLRMPTRVCGTMLLPGRYVFRVLNLSTEPNHVEILNEDGTQLVAEFTYAE